MGKSLLCIHQKYYNFPIFFYSKYRYFPPFSNTVWTFLYSAEQSHEYTSVGCEFSFSNIGFYFLIKSLYEKRKWWGKKKHFSNTKLNKMKYIHKLIVTRNLYWTIWFYRYWGGHIFPMLRNIIWGCHPLIFRVNRIDFESSTLRLGVLNSLSCTLRSHS